MVTMMADTCIIRIRDAPVKLRKDFKALCAKRDKNYRDMLQELISVYEDKVRYA